MEKSKIKVAADELFDSTKALRKYLLKND